MAPPPPPGAARHGVRGRPAAPATLAGSAALAAALLLSGCRAPVREAERAEKAAERLVGPLRSPLQALKLGAVSCPKGYVPHDGHIFKGGKVEPITSMEECGARCGEWDDCLSVEYSPSEKICIWNTQGGRPEAGNIRDYQFCEKPPNPSLKKILYSKEEYIEQEGAQIRAGGNVRVYVIGSSNVLWMTWIDQLHLHLLRLGYKVPTVPAKTAVSHYPSEPQMCDDSRYFTALKTARMGKIGWHSWDFSYDNWSDCLEDSSHNYGYRWVGDYKVKCEHGPGCAFGRDIVPASSIAEDASWSDITLVSTWFNDDQPDALKCFYGRKIPREDIANMSITGLLRTTRSIHARNPDVWVLILAKYSNFRHYKIEWVEDLHALIKAAVEKEPRTLFIEYDQPHPGNWNFDELWQKAHPNHPNCRGSKLMAHSILERLYKEKILTRTIKLVDKLENVNARNCEELHGAVCHTSVLCWEDPADGKCKHYSGGSTHFYQHKELLGRRWEAFKK